MRKSGNGRGFKKSRSTVENRCSQAVKREGQAVKADFRGSRILTPVADGSMGSVGVTTP